MTPQAKPRLTFKRFFNTLATSAFILLPVTGVLAVTAGSPEFFGFEVSAIPQPSLHLAVSTEQPMAVHISPSHDIQAKAPVLTKIEQLLTRDQVAAQAVTAKPMPVFVRDPDALTRRTALVARPTPVVPVAIVAAPAPSAAGLVGDGLTSTRGLALKPAVSDLTIAAIPVADQHHAVSTASRKGPPSLAPKPLANDPVRQQQLITKAQNVAEGLAMAAQPSPLVQFAPGVHVPLPSVGMSGVTYVSNGKTFQAAPGGQPLAIAELGTSARPSGMIGGIGAWTTVTRQSLGRGVDAGTGRANQPGRSAPYGGNGGARAVDWKQKIQSDR